MNYTVYDIAEMFENLDDFEVFEEIDEFLYVWGEDTSLGCIFRTKDEEIYAVTQDYEEDPIVHYDNFDNLNLDPASFWDEDYDEDPRSLNGWLRDGALLNEAKDY